VAIAALLPSSRHLAILSTTGFIKATPSWVSGNC
jgi:hypothetical protein